MPQLLLLPAAALVATSAAAAALPVSGYGSMLQEYMLNAVRECAGERSARIAALNTREEAEAYVAEVREKLRRCFGALPPACPPDPRITGTLSRNGIAVEKILFDSTPGVTVSANLYRPEYAAEPVPGVVVFCGHDESGKAAYQQVGFELAACGYATLVIDPYGQGERREFAGPDPAGIIPAGSVFEHLQPGAKLRLAGEFLGARMVRDGLAAIDYLASRPEVDAQRIAITGTSGGGTQTTLTGAFAEVPFLIAPSCYITTMADNIANENAVDSEQVLPGLFAAGLEMGDLLIAAAPRRIHILAQDNDFFDPRGAETTFREVKKIYTLLGFPEQVEKSVTPGNHGFAPAHRRLLTDTIRQATGSGSPWREQRPEERFPGEELAAFPAGTPAARPLARMLCAYADRFDRELPAFSAANVEQVFRNALLADQPPAVPHYRVLRTMWPGDDAEYYVARFALETEPGITAILSLAGRGYDFHLPENLKKAILYIPNLAAEPERRMLLENGDADTRYFCIEPRGIGECRVMGAFPYEDTVFQPYGSYYMYASIGDMLDRPLLAGMVNDAWSAVRLLRATGVKELELRGDGQGAVIAALTALQAGAQVDRVVLTRAPESYRALLRREWQYWPQAMLLPGVLPHSDLDQLYEWLKLRGGTVTVATPQDEIDLFRR